MDFAKDRGEEDGVGLLDASLGHFRESMAGDGDDRLGMASRCVELADLGGGKLAGSGSEVNSVGPGGEGYICAGVDEQPDAGADGDGGENASGQIGKRGCGEVFFAELDEVDAVRRPARALADECRLLLPVFAGKQGAAGDGVADHASQV